MVTSVFSNVGLMFVYIVFGFIMCKSKKANVSHAKTMSAFLLYVLSPAMIFNAFFGLEYTYEGFIKIGKFFLITLCLQILFMLVLYSILRKRYEDAKYRILSVASVLGNVGFIGMPIISGVFKDEPIVLCYSSANILSMNLIVFTIGVFLITNNKKYVSIKSAILNPTTLSMLVAIPIYILGIKFTPVVYDSIGLLAKMVTPICMFILGMRLSAMDLKKMFTRPFVYITCLLKLVAFPVFAFLCVWWIPFLDNIIKTSIVILATTPSGAIIESLAELHDCEQELSANVVILTTLLSIATIPIVSYLLIFM